MAVLLVFTSVRDGAAGSGCTLPKPQDQTSSSGEFSDPLARCKPL